MKFFKLLMVTLIIGGIVFLSISCTGTGSASATPKTQIATVQRGNISIQVTGTGFLALENKQTLSFGQTGLASAASNAKISDVLVKEGDIVDQSTVLVKADTQDWQDTLTRDQHALDSAKDALLQSQNALATAQNTLTTDQNNLTTDQNTQDTDQSNLMQIKDVQDLQDKIDAANVQLEQAQLMLKAANQQSDPDAYKYWHGQINYYTVDSNPSTDPLHKADGGVIGQYTQQIKDLLADPAHYYASQAITGTSATASINAIKAAQTKIQQDQFKIQQDQIKIQQDQMNIQQTKSSITLRQNAVDDAQSTFNDDQNSPQQIAAPFKGLITKVKDASGNDLKPGAIVSRSAPLIEIADPDKFIANIQVTERDVMQIKVGGDATVSFDALTGLNFPAKITQIAPLSTLSQGVVNYKVTVELTSTRPVFAFSGSQGTSRPANGASPSASAPAQPQPSGSPSPSRTPTITSGGTPPAAGFTVPSITLKDGLSTTVNILIQQKDNVLMVPSRAISRQGRNSTVQVVKGTTSETQTVQTGITDSTNTEIISGLNEGDQVLIQSITATPRAGGLGGPPGGGVIIR